MTDTPSSSVVSRSGERYRSPIGVWSLAGGVLARESCGGGGDGTCLQRCQRPACSTQEVVDRSI